MQEFDFIQEFESGVSDDGKGVLPGVQGRAVSGG
jgi:hypothetical protein